MSHRQAWMMCGLLMFLPAAVQAEIYRWDNGQLIPGTEGIAPGPSVYLGGWNSPRRNLRFADFSDLDLTEAHLRHSWLDNSRFNGANLTNASLDSAILTNADFSGAILTDAVLSVATLTNANFAGAVVLEASFSRSGITLQQLYSTASYQQENLRGTILQENDLTGGDLSGQDLTGASLYGSRLAGANLTDAVVRGVNFGHTTRGFTQEQLYSTASYQQKNLQGIGLYENNLSGWDLSGQDLTSAVFENATLSNANFTGADLTGANLVHARLSGANLSAAIVNGAIFAGSTARGFTKEQLYATASYQQGNLQGIRLFNDNLTGWDLSGQDLTGAGLDGSRLTNANLTDAVVRGVNFGNTTTRGFTKEQLYSTASYQQKNLQGIGSIQNNLSGWDLSGQDLTSAGFWSAALRDTNLAGANLTSADFTHATLSYANFTGANLTSADFTIATLSDANFSGADLTGANLDRAVLGGANLSAAIVNGAIFDRTTARGFTKEQLYATASYQQRNLQGIRLDDNDLTGWDLSGQDLTGAGFSQTHHPWPHDWSILTNTNLTGSIVAEARFSGATGSGFTKEQLYSTASYQQKQLRGIELSNNDLTGWDLSGQDLTGASLADSTLTDVSLVGATVIGADFYETRLTQSQLDSTASYRQKNLRGIKLPGNGGTGWDLSGQDLTGASFFVPGSICCEFAILTNTNLSGAIVNGVDFSLAWGFLKEQLYSTASYQQGNLQGIRMANNDLAGWDLSGQDLAGADFSYSQLTSADFSFADLRGAQMPPAPIQLARNTIRENGAINGLDLAAGETLVVRDSDIGITVNGSMNAISGGTLELVLGDAEWGSTIAVAAGITPDLGGTLRVRFADQANLALLLGTTFDFFDWPAVLETDNRFDAIELPPDTHWELTQLYLTGTATLTAIPEPSAVLLLACGAAAWSLAASRHRRRGER